MSAAIAEPLDVPLLAGISGRFLPLFRNRPVGHEIVRAATTAAGGLRLSAETDLAVERFQLRQSVEAEFDCALRPRSCIVSATSGPRQMSLEIQIRDDRADVRCILDGETQARVMLMPNQPLLLIDNCFALHAVAALLAGACTATPRLFTPIPACFELRATAPGAGAILLGGQDLGLPDVTMHLAGDLEEHAWIRGGWVERLALPRAQMRIDWRPDQLIQGES
jgi:hypothetical protein